MDAPEPVACPLCGAVVRDKPAKDASDIHDLERHLAAECPARVSPESGANPA